jgi:hypothetical protein
MDRHSCHTFGLVKNRVDLCDVTETERIEKRRWCGLSLFASVVVVVVVVVVVDRFEVERWSCVMRGGITCPIGLHRSPAQ